MTTLLKFLTISITISWGVFYGDLHIENNSTTTRTEHAHNSDGEFCASDEVRQNLFQNNPQKKAYHENLEKQVYEFLQNQPPKAENPPIYTLPIVVHVIHQNGAENLPLPTIQQAIQDLNDAFENVGYYDQNTGVDVQIGFCLAKQDPDGNPTTGVTRDFNALTNMAISDDLAVKDLNRWDPLRYINIWLVREIAGGVAGYAYLPSSHGGAEDGIVVEAQYFGSTQSNSSVHVHEMGHYLGLYHTFEGGCVNDDCLNDGDRVCDTPPDQTTVANPCDFFPNSCSTDVNAADPNNPFTTDQDDLFNNYMDYGNLECYNMFTQGQADRMQFFVENVRQSLLDSDGCNDPCPVQIIADFTASDLTVDIGNFLNFINSSINATDFEWKIDGNIISNDPNITNQFNEIGFFEVTLVASNPALNSFCVDSLTVTIEVTCPVEASFIQDKYNLDVNEVVNMTNTSINATNFEWFVDGNLEATTTDFSTSFGTPGDYSIYLVASDSLCSDTTVLTNFVRVGNCDVSIAWNPDAPSTCDDIQFSAFSSCQFDSYYWSFCEPDLLDVPDIPANLSVGSSPAHCDFFDNSQNGTGFHLFVTRYNQSVNRIERYDFGNDINSTPTQTTLNTPGIPNAPDYIKNEGIEIVFENGEYYGFLAVWNHIYRLDFGTDLTNNSPEVTLVGGAYQSEFNWAHSLDLYKIGANWWGIVAARSGELAILYFGNEIEGDVLSVSTYDGGNNNAQFTGATFIVENDNYYVLAADFQNGLIRFDFGNSLANVPTTQNLGFFGTGNQWSVLAYKECGDSYAVYVLKETGDDHKLLRFTPSITSTPVIESDINGLGRTSGVSSFHRVGDELLAYVVRSSDSEVARFSYTNCENSVPGSSNLQFPNTVYYDSAGTYPIKLIVDEGLPTQQIICAEITIEECFEERCFNGRDDDGDGLIDCYDPDCCGDEACEDFYYVECPVDCTIEPQAGDFEIEIEWSTANQPQDWCNYNTPIVADIDRDGVPEILGKSCTGLTQILANPFSELLIVDGITGQIETVLQTPAVTYGNDGPSVADLDGNGLPEIFFHASDNIFNENYVGTGIFNGDVRRRIVCYEYDPTNATGSKYAEKWVSNAVLGFSILEEAYPISSADFDGDGIAEVYAGNRIFNGQTGELILTGTITDPRGIHENDSYLNQAGAYSVAADVLPDDFCDNCEGLELVAGNGVYSIKIDPVNVLLGEMTLEVEHTDNEDGRTSLADIDNDGDLDALVTVNRGGIFFDGEVGVYVWDIQTSDIVINYFEVRDTTSDISHANIADFDGDGKVETGICSNQQYTVLKPNGNNFEILWELQTTDASGQTGSTVFDFNNDGAYEVVYRDQNNVRILDGATGTQLVADPCLSSTRVEYPVVVDVDNDGETELLCSCQNELRAYGSASSPWVPTRPVWNQHSYFNVNINDDLSVPDAQQPHHIVGDSVVLNNFLTQYADLNFPVPDVTVRVDSFGCGVDSFMVILEICNIGDARLTGEMPIAFYDANPTTSAANVLTVKELGQNLDPDDCIFATYFVPSLYDMPVYVVVNDDTSLVTPFDLINDFPATSIAECDYSNNLDSLLLEGPPPPKLDLGPDVQLVCDNGIFELNAGSGFVSYEWSDGSTDSTLTVWLEDEYWVNVIDSCGNLQSDTMEIVFDFETINMVEPMTATICPGESVEFCVQGDYWDHYEWQEVESLSCTDCACTIATPEEPGSYTVIAWTDEGCYSIDTVLVFFGSQQTEDEIFACPGETVIIHGMPVIAPGNYSQTFTGADGCDSTSVVTLINFLQMNISFDATSSCEAGSNGSITANVTSGTPPFNYDWDISGVGNVSSVDDLPPGNYSVTITDDNNCTRTAIGTVPVGNDIVFDSNVVNTCEGGNQGVISLDSISGTAPFVFEWDIPGVGNVTEVTGLDAGNYNVTITDANNCTLELSFTVGITGKPNVIFDLTNADCEDSPTGVMSISNPDPAWTYSLDGVNFQNGFTFNGLSSGTQDLFIQEGPCLYEYSFTIEADPLPALESTSQAPTCPGDDGNDGEIEVLAPVTAGWTYSIDGQNFQSSTNFSGLNAGDYTLTAVRGDCIISETVTVAEAQSFEVEISEFPPAPHRLGDTILLVASAVPPSTLIESYAWSPPSDGLTCLNAACDSVQVILTEDIEYTAILTDELGCVNSRAIELIVTFECTPENVKFPNAFTPDEDDLNDVFQLVPNKESDAQITSMEIFNRWGQKVFEATEGNFFWDGTQNGEPAAADIYVWVVNYTCGGDNEKRHGEVVLLR